MDASLPVVMALVAISAVAMTWLLRAEAAAPDLWRRAWRLLELAVGLLLMLGLLYVGLLQIVVRYAPAGMLYASWTEELARLMLVWLTFWGAAMVQRTDGHMSVSVLFDLLPPGARRALHLLDGLAVLAILVVLATAGWQVAYSQLGQTTITLDLSIAAFACAVPVGGTLMLVFVLVDLARRFATPGDGRAAG